MRFMIIVKSSGSNCAATALPDAEFVTAMQTFNNELAAAGVLLALEGLHPPSTGVRVSAAGGKWKISDGPFAETKEMIGGFWIWQVDSRQEALDWIQRCPLAMRGEAEIEMREVIPIEEFAARLAPAFVAQTQRAAA